MPDPIAADEPEQPDEAGRPETQEERAMRTLQSIWAGGDLTEETMKLANEFTDRHTGRFSDWFRRVILRRG